MIDVDIDEFQKLNKSKIFKWVVEFNISKGNKVVTFFYEEDFEVKTKQFTIIYESQLNSK